MVDQRLLVIIQRIEANHLTRRDAVHRNLDLTSMLASPHLKPITLRIVYQTSAVSGAYLCYPVETPKHDNHRLSRTILRIRS